MSSGMSTRLNARPLPPRRSPCDEGGEVPSVPTRLLASAGTRCRVSLEWRVVLLRRGGVDPPCSPAAMCPAGSWRVSAAITAGDGASRRISTHPGRCGHGRYCGGGSRYAVLKIRALPSVGQATARPIRAHPPQLPTRSCGEFEARPHSHAESTASDTKLCSVCTSLIWHSLTKVQIRAPDEGLQTRRRKRRTNF